jgi:hypothetical protein
VRLLVTIGMLVVLSHLSIVGDVRVRLRRGANLLDAHVVHVEDAVAGEHIAQGVDAPDFVAVRAPPAVSLRDLQELAHRRPEPKIAMCLCIDSFAGRERGRPAMPAYGFATGDTFGLNRIALADTSRPR